MSKEKNEIPSVTEDTEQLKLAYIALGSVEIVQPFRKIVWQILLKLKIYLLYNPVI